MSSPIISAAAPPSGDSARDIPGDYGHPFFGPLFDRYNYYYVQGEVEYFKARMKKHQSTVFRCNMPPGPFLARNPRVICLLDAISFQTLFDSSKVEKKNVLDGTFMPSTAFTGGYRACAFLDTSEHNHAALKGFFLSILAKKHDKFVPMFRQALSTMLSGLEDEFSAKGSAYFNDLSDRMSFEFVFRLFCDKQPSETPIGTEGPRLFDLWLLFQLHPLMTLGLKYLPNFLEDLLLHTFPLPFGLVKSKYQKLYDAFYSSAGSILDEAEEVGLKRDEACHNLVFLAGFNAYGGMKTLFPGLIKWIGAAGEDLHRRLRDEIRATVKSEGGVTFAALNKMVLTKSAVYEALRIEPPVPYQYGKAREDLTIQSHESSFLIKKGEMLFGYQPIVTKDPLIFKNPDEFIADRFVGSGEELIQYVYWSNGKETEDPTTDNKQCPGKDIVVTLSRLMLVEFFLRFDAFQVESGKLLAGSSVTFKSITKST
ncbi:allene oxide synthase, chloroplastic [Dorcoceras hygrometricum]|uniref:Allene oxide synthase, chloroplastic n=1 Tax=Dorcoceras hygrometricum TaxID=472368 RepID=A0A2Z7D816_9LAMI|nr:allene oxide synthase, chloroplastic [Dorcoceras hygrometricum]